MTYETISVGGLKKPLYFQRDGAKLWVCVRSVCEALCMAWPRWAMFFMSVADVLGLRAALDHAGRETWLLESRQGGRLFLRLAPGITTNRRASRALQTLRMEWAHVLGVANGQREACMPERYRGPQRKITAEVVRSIYELRQQGLRWGEIGVQLGLAGETVRIVGSGRYRGWDEPAARAWDATFGVLNLPGTPLKAVAGGTRRKAIPTRQLVDADVVQRIYMLHQQKIPGDAIAASTRVSTGTVRSIVSGKYQFTNAEASAVWKSTFGHAARPNTGGIGSDLGGDGATPCQSLERPATALKSEGRKTT